MKDNWRRVCSIGLVLVIVVSMLMSVPMISAKKPSGPPPPPADPAIAFHMRERVRGDLIQGLWVMNVDGSNLAVIFAEENYVVHAPSWSPDGQSIAWSGYTYVSGIPGYDYGVWRIDVEIVNGVPQGTNLQQLVSEGDEEVWISSVAWSPLGDEIAYNIRIWGTDTHPTMDKIDGVSATGGTPYNIYTAPEGHAIDISSGLAWSSDGTRLAAVGGEVAAGLEGMSIMIIERATGVVTHRLLTGQYNFAGLDWARQGVDKIVFHDSKPYGWVYTVDIETESVDAIVQGGNPSWSPDNSKIVFFQPTIEKVKLGIKIYEFSTGELTTLLNDGRVPDWRRF